MKTDTLRLRLRVCDFAAPVFVTGPDNKVYAIDKVAGSINEPNAIIETADTRELVSMKAGELYDVLAEFAPDADAEIFIREGCGTFYFDVANLRRHGTGYTLVLGAFRCGG